jgi:hypothetical protein
MIFLANYLGLLDQSELDLAQGFRKFGADGEILAGLPGVISAAREAGMGPEEFHFFVTEPEERLGGALPLDLLRRGEGRGPPALGQLGTVLG